jgi:hypothetical protein
VEPEPVEKLSADRRRTLQQRNRLAAGIHPLQPVAGHVLKLHPDAPRTDDPEAPGPRCGTCWYRQVLPYHNRSYPKCLFPDARSPEEVERLGYPRAAHSSASDVRAWWGACGDYSPGDGAMSPDAARYIPEAVTR